MNARSPSSPGAQWRERFIAIAREVPSAIARPAGRSRVGIRPRPAGAAPVARFSAFQSRS